MLRNKSQLNEHNVIESNIHNHRQDDIHYH